MKYDYEYKTLSRKNDEDVVQFVAYMSPRTKERLKQLKNFYKMPMAKIVENLVNETFDQQVAAGRLTPKNEERITDADLLI
jgi:hypothetical protein